MNFNIAEKFISINGEGVLAGQLAVFIRFCGCNLECSYCDTRWANTMKPPVEVLDEHQIYRYIKETGIKMSHLPEGNRLFRKEYPFFLRNFLRTNLLG